MPEAVPSILEKTTAGLPNWAWGLVIVAGMGVGYLFVRSKNAQTSTNQTTATAAPITDTGGTSQAPLGGGGDQVNPVLTVPGGSSGSVPILPPGYTPIYDNQGNLIGWEPPVTPPTQTAPGGSGGTSSGGTFVNPLIPLGQWNTGPYTLRKGAKVGYADTVVVNGVEYSIAGGQMGRIWGVPGKMTWDQALRANNKTLLYASASAYH